MTTNDDVSTCVTAMFQAIREAELKSPRNSEARLPDLNSQGNQDAIAFARQVGRIPLLHDPCLDACRVERELQQSAPQPERPGRLLGLGQRVVYWLRSHIGRLVRSSETPFNDGAAKTSDL